MNSFITHTYSKTDGILFGATQKQKERENFSFDRAVLEDKDVVGSLEDLPQSLLVKRPAQVENRDSPKRPKLSHGEESPRKIASRLAREQAAEAKEKERRQKEAERELAKQQKEQEKLQKQQERENLKVEKERQKESERLAKIKQKEDERLEKERVKEEERQAKLKQKEEEKAQKLLEKEEKKREREEQAQQEKEQKRLEREARQAEKLEAERQRKEAEEAKLGLKRQQLFSQLRLTPQKSVDLKAELLKPRFEAQEFPQPIGKLIIAPNRPRLVVPQENIEKAFLQDWSFSQLQQEFRERYRPLLFPRSKRKAFPLRKEHPNLTCLKAFSLDCRPATFKAFSRKSRLIRSRQPFAKDEHQFDYEVDSDAEWEEGEGEDLGNVSAEEEEDGKELEEYDDFLVPDGYLSEEEGLGGNAGAFLSTGHFHGEAEYHFAYPTASTEDALDRKSVV